MPLFSISVLFPCEIYTVIISDIEKATLTRCAIFSAVEQKIGMEVECSTGAHIKLVSQPFLQTDWCQLVETYVIYCYLKYTQKWYRELKT